MKRRKFFNLSLAVAGMVTLTPSLTAATSIVNLGAKNAGKTEDYSKWKYSAGIILDTTESGASVAGDVHNIAIPLRFNMNVIEMAGVSATGADLRFARPDGTPVPYCIQRWERDKKGFRAEAWVLLDIVKGNTREEALHVYWGNPSAVHAGNNINVFDISKGYTGVWHLDEPGNTQPGGYKDSSATCAHGTGTNLSEISRIEGVIAGAQDFGIGHAAGEGAMILVDPAKKQNFSFKKGVTVSVWARIGQWQNVFETLISKGDNEWRLSRVSRTNVIEFSFSGFTPEYVLSTGEMADGKWHHIVGTCTGKSINLYIDGQLNSSTATEGTPNTSGYDVLIGSNSERPGRNYCGMLDEIMVLDEGRDANWVKLLYESQNADQKLIRIKKLP